MYILVSSAHTKYKLAKTVISRLGCAEIWNFSSKVQLDISRVKAAFYLGKPIENAV